MAAAEYNGAVVAVRSDVRFAEEKVMGFSPGEFEEKWNRKNPRINRLHWEGKSESIVLWNADESEILLCLDAKNARKAADQLSLLADMLEEKRL